MIVNLLKTGIISDVNKHLPYSHVPFKPFSYVYNHID